MRKVYLLGACRTPIGKMGGTLSTLSSSDLGSVEAVSENVEIKKAVFHELDLICKPECIFATNTSSLPIKAVEEGLSRPMVGMHFFNPAPVMKIVEIIASDKAPQTTVDYLMEVARKIGKTPVEVR